MARSCAGDPELRHPDRMKHTNAFRREMPNVWGTKRPKVPALKEKSTSPASLREKGGLEPGCYRPKPRKTWKGGSTEDKRNLLSLSTWFSDHKSSSTQRRVQQGVIRQRKGKSQQYDRRSPDLHYICIQLGPVPPQEALQRLTNGTEVYKPVLPLLRVDQVISALLGGSSLQHCFKQWVVETSVS